MVTYLLLKRLLLEVVIPALEDLARAIESILFGLVDGLLIDLDRFLLDLVYLLDLLVVLSSAGQPLGDGGSGVRLELSERDSGMSIEGWFTASS